MCNLWLVSAFRGLGPLKAHESRRDQLLGWTQTKLFKIFLCNPLSTEPVYREPYKFICFRIMNIF